MRRMVGDGVLVLVVILLFPITIVLVGLPVALGIRLMLTLVGLA